MLSSVVVDGNFVNFCIVGVDEGGNEDHFSIMCCSELDSVLLSVLNSDVIGTYLTVVVSNLVEVKPFEVLLLLLLLLLIGV